MKKIGILSLLAISLAFASCGKKNTDETSTTQTTETNASADGFVGTYSLVKKELKGGANVEDQPTEYEVGRSFEIMADGNVSVMDFGYQYMETMGCKWTKKTDEQIEITFDNYPEEGQMSPIGMAANYKKGDVVATLTKLSPTTVEVFYPTATENNKQVFTKQ